MLRYKRSFAIVLCAVAALMPVTALAEGLVNLPETTEQVQQTTAETLPATETDPTADPATETAAPVDTENPLSGETDSAETIAETAAPAAAAPVQAGPHVVLNGVLLTFSTTPVEKDGTLFVPLRDFGAALGCSYAWVNGSTVTLTRSDLSATFTLGSTFVSANGRVWYMDDPCITFYGCTMVPVRALAKIFSCTVAWTDATETATLVGGNALTPASQYYNANDLLWLARIIWCEAGNQPLEGKVAVANVILNRVKSPSFPNTIYGVIFDRSCGVQFTPTASSRIYCTPTDSCYTAAKLALEGYVTAPGCLYFIAARSASSCWAARNRPYYGVIGDHVFYK